MITLCHHPIDPSPLRQYVQRPEAGAIISFEGCTRNNFEGLEVHELRYEAYETMAHKELSALKDRLEADYPQCRVAIAHRLGVVPVGEVSVLTVVSAPHRDVAYLVSRRAIDELKLQIPIWKKEIYSDGSSWKANPS